MAHANLGKDHHARAMALKRWRGVPKDERTDIMRELGRLSGEARRRKIKRRWRYSKYYPPTKD